MTAARLLWPRPLERPRAIVLVLPGGTAHSHARVRSWQPPVLRMLPFARAVASAGRGQLAVASLRYAVRGWNGAEASPLGDAHLALEQVAAAHPDVPVGLLGYSMGGRVALHLADDERVRAVVALAPWVEPRDRPHGHPGLALLVMHGTGDRITSPQRSREAAATLAARGVDATYRAVAGDDHTMLRRAGRWHRESAQFLADHLLPG